MVFKNIKQVELSHLSKDELELWLYQMERDCSILRNEVERRKLNVNSSDWENGIDMFNLFVIFLTLLSFK